MTSQAESEAACQAYLGVLFAPLHDDLDVEDVELVMRDARRFAGAAAMYSGTAMAVPRLARLQVGSLTVVFELIGVAGGTIRVLASFLKLVEKYWNFRRRIALEDARLRQAMDDLDDKALERTLERLDELSGLTADKRMTAQRLQAYEGALRRQLEVVGPELDQARERERKRELERQQERRREREIGDWGLGL